MAEIEREERERQKNKVENGENGNLNGSESVESAALKKEKEQKYMFADFDMEKWNEVNVYDQGIWNNLKMVYRPYSKVQNEIDAAKKRDGDDEDDQNANGDVNEEDLGILNGTNVKPNTEKKKLKNGSKFAAKTAGSKGQKLRKRRKSKK